MASRNLKQPLKSFQHRSCLTVVGCMQVDGKSWVAFNATMYHNSPPSVKQNDKRSKIWRTHLFKKNYVRLIEQQNGNVSWWQHVQITQLAWPMCLVLSLPFSVINWPSCSVAKSACYDKMQNKHLVPNQLVISIYVPQGMWCMDIVDSPFYWLFPPVKNTRRICRQKRKLDSIPLKTMTNTFKVTFQ